MSYRLFFWVLVCSAGSAAEEQQQVKVQRGQDAVLQCGGPADASVILLEWTRLDLKADGYVFFYRNKQFYEIYQLPSFHGRVALVDPQVRGGDFSVVLKNADISDSGSYECRVVISTPGQTTHSEIKRVMELQVTEPELTAGRLRGGASRSRAGGAAAALALIGLLLLVE
ncbi:nectin-4-like [Sparus aurata]|uniref:nectin-4-like n=1 Tax=Sparus aurata TaxID=8175 RepID=UPI0011C0EA85|nr:nectin-4-like [Sparus aurata]